MAWAGVPVIYLAAAGLVVLALMLTWRLKMAPGARTGGVILVKDY